jgi:hypothetical protein
MAAPTPCPFCGSARINCRRYLSDAWRQQVNCLDCDAAGPSISETDAIAALSSKGGSFIETMDKAEDMAWARWNERGKP